jgi:hypothetical protein
MTASRLETCGPMALLDELGQARLVIRKLQARNKKLRNERNQCRRAIGMLLQQLDSRPSTLDTSR